MRSFVVRMPPELHALMKSQAEKSNTSMNATIVARLEEHETTVRKRAKEFADKTADRIVAAILSGLKRNVTDA